MSKAKEAYLEYEITNGLNPKIHNYVKELEEKVKELELKCKDEYTRGHADGYDYCLDETDEDD